jgi:hypothetical protein
VEIECGAHYAFVVHRQLTPRLLVVPLPWRHRGHADYVLVSISSPPRFDRAIWASPAALESVSAAVQCRKLPLPIHRDPIMTACVPPAWRQWFSARSAFSSSKVQAGRRWLQPPICERGRRRIRRRSDSTPQSSPDFERPQGLWALTWPCAESQRAPQISTITSTN